MTVVAISGARVVSPDGVLDGHAVVVRNGLIEAVRPRHALISDLPVHDLAAGWLLPGFIDTQVNGGGDVLLNDRPDVQGVAAVAAAHRRYGTTSLTPTLISDDQSVVDQAIRAVEEAIGQGVPGIVGIHVEGPHLNPVKKGIHDPSKMRVLDDEVIATLSAPSRGVRVVTLAPEMAPQGAIARLSSAGVRVCAGHSDADHAATVKALGEGLAGFTHLFNAMTQLGSREPGMVGAALDDRASRFGIIVDGLHVHPATLRIALRARGIEGVMLVTDAMPPVGGTASFFDLMGVRIDAVDGTCRGPGGTLAGSTLSMAQAFRNALRMLDVDVVAASRMASANPAAFLGLTDRGSILPGLRADLVHLDDDLRVRGTWIGGVFEGRGE